MGAQVTARLGPCCLEEGNSLTPYCATPGSALGQAERVITRASNALKYPMWVLPVQDLLELKELRAHEELLASASNPLVQFTPDMGDAIYVSHQWCSTEHPDPKCLQFRVLQAALRNITSGHMKMQLHWLNQLRQSVPLTMRNNGGHVSIDDEWLTQVTVSQEAGQMGDDEIEGFRLCYIWYDYLCVPQPYKHISDADGDTDMVHESVTDDQLSVAIESIPAYVELAKHLLVLAPAVKHQRSGEALSYSTWRTRGWCRLERAARFFSVADSRLILVQSPNQMQILGAHEALFQHPGQGAFALPFDCGRVGSVMETLVVGKLKACLASRDFHGFRVMLNMRNKLFQGLPLDLETAGLPPILLSVQASIPVAGAKGNNATRELERFFTMNRIGNLNEFSEAGWMPIHYAAVSCCDAVVRGLLQQKVNPNGVTAKPDHAHFIESGATPLMLAAYFHGGREVLELLLDHGASINITGCARNSALSICALSGNDVGMDLLLARRASMETRNLFDNSPIFLAAMLSRERQVTSLVRAHSSMAANKYGLNPLHQAALSLGEKPDVEIVRLLLEAQCDPDLRIKIPPKTLHGLVSHCAVIGYKFGRKSSFEWVSGRMGGATPASIASLFGNSVVREALSAEKRPASFSTAENTFRFSKAASAEVDFVAM